ncbi:YcaO-like family protein [Amycolatopsis sp. NPDC003731]
MGKVRELPQAGERGLALDAAIDHGLRAIRNRGWAAELTDLGGAPGAWKCALSADGRHLANGFGKGPGDSARAGAVFESLEHHVSGPRFVLPETVELRSSHEVAGGALRGDPGVAVLADTADDLLACRTYRDLAGARTTSVPVYLSCPDYLLDDHEELREELGDGYDYAVVERYATNSGCAAGSSEAEAVVHALNEAIERDAWSLLLLRTFLAPGSPAPAVIARDSLPEELAELAGYAEDRVGKPFTLIEMTTDLGVPSVMAYSAPEAGVPAHRFGCGASLSRRHAVTRALNEILQCVATDEAFGVPEPPLPEHLREYPPFFACGVMDFGEALTRAHSVRFVDTAAPGGPEQHLTRLAGILTGRGYRPWVRELFRADNGVAVVSVIVAGLEKFMVVTSGNLVVPGPRGRAAIRLREAG